MTDEDIQKQNKCPIESPIDANLSAHFPLRILLAEDLAVNQKLMVAMLGQLGYKIDVVKNGVEVLEALQHTTYDLVLMDLQMPKIDGLEATRRIVSQWPKDTRPHIVALTASAIEDARAACEAAGIDDYIVKPVPIKELQSVLTRYGKLVRERAGQAVGVVGNHKIAQGSSPLNQEILANLQCMRDNGMPEFIQELLVLFQDETPKLICAMQEAIHEGNAIKLRMSAHSLNGSAASLGATALSALCATLERNAREGSFANALTQVAELMPEYQRVCTALTQERQNL